MSFQFLKTFLRVILAVGFIVGGVLHFTHTSLYLTIMPPLFPAPRTLVYLSGVFEILGGVGILVARVRRFAAWGLILLLAAVLPANIYMATGNIAVNGRTFSPVLLWLRVPLQFVLMWLVWWSGNNDKPKTNGG